MPGEDSGGAASEAFALYGFKLAIPNSWRVEFNPKGTREKGDVVFQSPKRNRIFVSWGPLADIESRFKTIEEHRDWSVANLKKSRSVRSVSITKSEVSTISGHRALITSLSASSQGGFKAKKTVENHVNSVHFHCPENGRYYIIYSTLNSPDEYADFPVLFDTLAHSMNCHDSVRAPSPPDGK